MFIEIKNIGHFCETDGSESKSDCEFNIVFELKASSNIIVEKYIDYYDKQIPLIYYQTRCIESPINTEYDVFALFYKSCSKLGSYNTLLQFFSSQNEFDIFWKTYSNHFDLSGRSYRLDNYQIINNKLVYLGNVKWVKI